MCDPRRHKYRAIVSITLAAALTVIAVPAFAQSVFQATLAEANQKTPEANTADVQRALADAARSLSIQGSAPNMSRATSPAPKTRPPSTRC